ncbi:RUS family member 1 [Bicyclus anynana]|uniref:RUS family member 1 n=1 Tax=Bicyclus anynana TaxID=110368 RepID=A0ABM3M5P1_BICAN|nr:RUS family member 1 [Bicyclus anynana]
MEQETLFKEFSTEKRRTIVKPAGQNNVSVLKENQPFSIQDFITKIFLPRGYPDSVSKDYIEYQIYDCLQAACSTIIGIIAAQAVLKGVGVGNVQATALAATITWITKDLCGHLGQIMFAFFYGGVLDAYCKTWRLYADALNDLAMLSELALPLFPESFTILILCFSTLVYNIVGVAGSATRMAMTQHHAIEGNFADVSAKDAAQETAVNFVASIVALAFISIITNNIILIFILVLLHLYFNYRAVKSVILNKFNEPRYLHFLDSYFKSKTLCPIEVNLSESVFFRKQDDILMGYKIMIGQSLKQLTNYSADATYVNKIKNIYAMANYILIVNARDKIINVFLHENSTTDGILLAYFHAVVAAKVMHSIQNSSGSVLRLSKTKSFNRILLAIKKGELTRRNPTHSYEVQLEPSLILIKYLHEMVKLEWPSLRNTLRLAGWNVTNHSLIVGKWRVCQDGPKLNP